MPVRSPLRVVAILAALCVLVTARAPIPSTTQLPPMVHRCLHDHLRAVEDDVDDEPRCFTARGAATSVTISHRGLFWDHVAPGLALTPHAGDDTWTLALDGAAETHGRVSDLRRLPHTHTPLASKARVVSSTGVTLKLAPAGNGHWELWFHAEKANLVAAYRLHASPGAHAAVVLSSGDLRLCASNNNKQTNKQQQ
jgi:hypothetical protein